MAHFDLSQSKKLISRKIWVAENIWNFHSDPITHFLFTSNNFSFLLQDPLTNLQVAIKNNIDVFYFATIVPTHVYFGEDGNMEKKTFLATWKDIPAANEIQFSIEGADCNAGELIDNIYFF